MEHRMVVDLFDFLSVCFVFVEENLLQGNSRQFHASTEPTKNRTHAHETGALQCRAIYQGHECPGQPTAWPGHVLKQKQPFAVCPFAVPVPGRVSLTLVYYLHSQKQLECSYAEDQCLPGILPQRSNAPSETCS